MNFTVFVVEINVKQLAENEIFAMKISWYYLELKEAMGRIVFKYYVNKWFWLFTYQLYSNLQNINKYFAISSNVKQWNQM